MLSLIVLVFAYERGRGREREREETERYSFDVKIGEFYQLRVWGTCFTAEPTRCGPQRSWEAPPSCAASGILMTLWSITPPQTARAGAAAGTQAPRNNYGEALQPQAKGSCGAAASRAATS